MEDSAESVATTLGRPVTWRLEGSRVVIVSGGADRAIELADVTQVRLAKLGTTRICELRLRDGSARTVTNEDPAAREAYVGFIRRLHVQLAARADVKFVRGGWLLVGLALAAASVVSALALAMGFEWIVVPGPVANLATLIRVIALISVVTAPVVAWRSRPRRYDPADPPAE